MYATLKINFETRDPGITRLLYNEYTWMMQRRQKSITISYSCVSTCLYCQEPLCRLECGNSIVVAVVAVVVVAAVADDVVAVAVAEDVVAVADDVVAVADDVAYC